MEGLCPDKLCGVRQTLFSQEGSRPGTAFAAPASYGSAALRRNTPSVKAYGFATFPKGTALGGEGKLCGSAIGVPLGELARRMP